MPEAPSQCPSCKAPRKPEETACPMCGVIFAKWEARQKDRGGSEIAAKLQREMAAEKSSLTVKPKRERGILLNAFLILVLVMNGAALFILINADPSAFRDAPSWILPTAIVQVVLDLAFVFMIFGWKSLGAYGLLLNRIVGFGLYLMAFGWSNFELARMFLVYFIVVHLLRPVMAHMD